MIRCERENRSARIPDYLDAFLARIKDKQHNVNGSVAFLARRVHAHFASFARREKNVERADKRGAQEQKIVRIAQKFRFQIIILMRVLSRIITIYQVINNFISASSVLVCVTRAARHTHSDPIPPGLRCRSKARAGHNFGTTPHSHRPSHMQGILPFVAVVIFKRNSYFH